ncbi:hypothetical protein PCLA_13f0064 [Pseudomonas citronellolis]|uniref:hypothetical protein n=1 Tax=Pseudomonas citronellolis TaxID=53408 RepID=UPI000E2EC2A6|nr:hypothetical protein [Pseudomonas citronellolis]GBL59218.1 hypothetical protein PCLA_13f0064 [Pseudomonas citronellolis]
MELTTTQIIAGAIILAFIAIVAAIAYWSGNYNRWGEGYSAASNYWRPLFQQQRDEREETQRLLDCRTREIAALRANIQIEADDHAAVVRDLHRRLANTTTLTAEDRALLQGIAAKLTLAADTWSGLRVNDHAAAARAYADYATELAARAGLEQHEHPDTELIEWLDREATAHTELEYGELRFMLAGKTDGYSHIRDLLRDAMQQSLEIQENHQATLEATA